MRDDPKAPPPRVTSARAALHDALRGASAEGRTLTAKALSQQVSLSERDIPEHLEHLARSLKAAGAKLVVEPARCIACGYVFEDRTRLSAPGQCPECRSARIAPPAFGV